MAELKRRKRLFPNLKKDDSHKLRGFYRPQRDHPKQHMPLRPKQVKKIAVFEGVLDKESGWK